jgi:hypothetical protein
LRLCPLAPAEPSRHPPARAVSSSPLCATIPAPGAYKRTTPSFSIPHTSLGHPLPPSPSLIELVSPHPSPAPVSLALLPLLSSSLIHIVLELRHSLTNAMHPSPPPIALGSLAGTLRPNWPYPHDPLPPPVPRHHSSVAEENRREPHRWSSLTDSPLLRRPLHGVTPLLSLMRGPTPTTSARAAPLLRGSAGSPARARWTEIPPAQLAENSLSFFLFPFLFPIFIYIFIY